MKKKKVPKSVRKYIRQKKARIRREALDLKEQEKQITELYQKFFKKIKTKPNQYENSRNLQPSNK
jgi:DNA/RNA-binding domain of Phe-tRNA-synthetase-like protein